MESVFIDSKVPAYLAKFIEKKVNQGFSVPIMYTLPKINKVLIQNFIKAKDGKTKYSFEVLLEKEEQTQNHLILEVLNLFRKLYKVTLIEWFEAYSLAGLPQMTAARMFLDYYGIDEGDYSIDACLKCYLRHRNALNGK